MNNKTLDSSVNKGKFKEKIALLYEQESNDCRFAEQPHFWSEFFLLKPNLSFLSNRLDLYLRNEGESKIINKIVFECVKALCDQEKIRCSNGLRTLTQVIECCSNSQRCAESGMLTFLLFGNKKHAENLINQVITRCCSVFADPSARNPLSSLCLRLLLTFVTVYDDLNRNNLLDYFSNGNDLFGTLLQVLGSPMRRKEHGKDVLVLLTLLVNYRKYENVNPYIVMLSILDNDLALNGYSHSICTHFCSIVSNFYQNEPNSASSGILSSLSSMVGNILGSEEKISNPIEIDMSMLLALYEAIHLNRNFITTLTTVPADVSESVLNDSIFAANGVHDVKDLNESSNCNLLVAFLTYSSIIFSDLKTEKSRNAAKLCSIILTCITEPTRYRQRKLVEDRFLTSKRLICTILDICVEFIVSHMMKNLPCDLYLQIFGIIQRILCYEKKMRVRLEYDWRNLWDDTFLPNPTTYDLLYYELIRNGETFNNTHSMLLRYTATDNMHKDIALKLCNYLINIRGIVNHFHAKIVENLNTTAVTEDDILKIVRSNYDTLILKLQENLDFYEPYNEKPHETSYFSEMVKNIIADVKSKKSDFEFDYQCFLDS
uniref:Armadillo-like helical domain-containing protein n=1 Tax=Romanomermis culicivorax TaxID=13658 RepID=A0A915L191_ROMCU